MNLKTMIDVYPSWAGSGIFTDLQQLDVPWKTADIAAVLDVAYYGQHSGGKIISPFVEKFLTADGVLTGEARTSIARAIFTVCSKNWSKLWDTLNQEYNLLDNTDAYISETTINTGTRETSENGTNSGTIKHDITGTDTDTDTGTVKHDITGTDTDTDTGTVNHAVTGADTTTDTGTLKTSGNTGTDRTVNDDIYGFNSDSASNANKQTGKDTTTAEQTETHNLTDKVTHDTQDQETRNITHTLNKTDNDTETRDLTHTLNRTAADTETQDLKDTRTGNEKTDGTITHEQHRHGNIGVTTSQQMLQEERQLWQWYFYEYVFKDLDRFLTIGVY